MIKSTLFVAAVLAMSAATASALALAFPSPSPQRGRNVSSKWLNDYQDLKWLAVRDNYPTNDKSVLLPRRLGADCPVSSKHNPFRPSLIGNWTAVINDELGFLHAEGTCPNYRASKYRVKPTAAQQWWNKQKQMDHSQGGPRCEPHLPKAPRFVSYICCDTDQGAGLPSVDRFRGINVIVLAFMEINGPGGKLADFFKAPPQQRHDWIKALHARNISVMLSTFGGDASQQAITMKYDPVALGKLHGEIVRESGFDGLDNDMEDFQASMVQNHDLAEWVVAYTRAVRTQLPRGKYALSTAPIAPWFTTNQDRYCSGLFRQIDQEVGQEYDWYNLQFYNQGDGTYGDCNSILFKSNFDSFPDTSIFEIHKNTKIPLDKLVLGKPASQEDAESGYVAPATLAQCVLQAKKRGWNAGVMAWQWPNANSRWFQKVRGQAFPV